MSDDCVFCAKIAAGDYDEKVMYLPDGGPVLPNVVFEPLNPVTEGHKLVVPVHHAKTVADNPRISASSMAVAALVADRAGDCNIITSKGAAATQTVEHLHLHVVPRRSGDGLRLPWRRA